MPAEHLGEGAGQVRFGSGPCLELLAALQVTAPMAGEEGPVPQARDAGIKRSFAGVVHEVVRFDIDEFSGALRANQEMLFEGRRLRRVQTSEGIIFQFLGRPVSLRWSLHDLWPSRRWRHFH